MNPTPPPIDMRRSRLWVLLAAMVGCAITSALGFWQLDRAAQKQSLERDWLARQTLPALDGVAATQLAEREGWDRTLWRTVRLEGHWQEGATLYLDNRQMEGRPGFYVLTPLRLKNSEQSVLIQRGWVPRRFDDRSALPAVDTPTGPVEVHGQLAPPPAKLYEFGPEPGGPIRQNVDMPSLEREFRLALWPVSVLQTDKPALDAANVLQRAWPRWGAGVEKHHGYAFQWFGLSLLILILYVWFQLIAPRRRSLSQAGQ